MKRLPPRLEALIDEVIGSSELSPGSARRVRHDLEQHFSDGLASGASIEELEERFGDPAAAGRLLAEHPNRPPHFAHPRRLVRTMGTVVREARLAARGMRKEPIISSAMVAVFALGIASVGLASAIMDELVLQPLPVEDQASLVDIWPDIPGGNSFLGFSYGDTRVYREADGVLTGLAAFAGTRLVIGEEPGGERVVATFVSPEYFELLGIRGGRGRLGFPPESGFGETPEVVLSHSFWEESFGADPGIVGSTVVLDGHPADVIGIVPRGFRGHFTGFPTDLWLPITAAVPLIDGFDPTDDADLRFEMIGRLRPGITAPVAEDALQRIAADLDRTRPVPDLTRGLGVTRTTGLDHSMYPVVVRFTVILSSVATLVLLTACFNVGTLLLVRAIAKGRETAVRMALGAGRADMLARALAGALLPAVFGTLVGLVAAHQLGNLLSRVLEQFTGGVSVDLEPGGRVVAAAVVAGLIAATFAGLVPGVHALKQDVVGGLRSRHSGRRLATRLRGGLVIGQAAASVMLVWTSAIFARSLLESSRRDPGIASEELVSFRVALTADGADEELGDPRLVELVQALGEVEDVGSVSYADGPPLGVARSPVGLEIPGVAPPPGQDRILVDVRRAGPGYLRTLGVPLIAGRDLERADLVGPAVAIVSQAFAEAYWPGEDAVGQSMLVGDAWTRVVGLASDARYLVQDEEPDALVYVAMTDVGGRVEVVVRADDPGRLSADLNRAVASVIPGRAAGPPRLVSRALREGLLPQLAGTAVIGSMGFATLLLAAVGLFGMIQFIVEGAGHELGVRRALGAGRRELAGIVLRRGLAPPAIGVALGALAALALGPALTPFLGGVLPTDVPTVVVVGLVLAAAALLSSALPVGRAVVVNPARVLRED